MIADRANVDLVVKGADQAGLVDPVDPEVLVFQVRIPSDLWQWRWSSTPTKMENSVEKN